MDKYSVELAPSAAEIYENICRLAADTTDSGYSRLQESVDDVFDNVIPFRPFEIGTELGGSLGGLYYVSRETIHVFYEKSSKPRTLVVIFIWDGPNSEAHEQQADAICTQMLLSARLQPVTRPRVGIAATN